VRRKTLPVHRSSTPASVSAALMPVSGFPVRKSAAPVSRNAAHGRRSAPLILVSGAPVGVKTLPLRVSVPPARVRA
jgi:hypothetical protein